MTVAQHYARLGIRIIESHDFRSALVKHANNQSVIDHERLTQRHDECGDLDSADELGHFIYAMDLPTLDMTFAAAYQALRYRIDEIELPRIRAFCEDSTSVLDAGCGGGVILTYLATELPETRFVGVDRLPEAVEQCDSRIRQLGLTNASAVIGDAFDLPNDLVGQFDTLILRCVLDDTRKPYTPWSAAEFDAAYKLTAARRCLADGGRIWLSNSVVPEGVANFLNRIQKDISESGLGIGDFKHSSTQTAC